VSREIWKKSMNFEEKFEKIRKYFDTENAGLEKILGLSNGYISNIGKKKISTPGKLLVVLSEKGISADWFLTGDGEMLLSNRVNALENTSETGLKRLPVYSASELPEGTFIVPLLDQRLSAGQGSYLPEEDTVKALIHVPSYLSHYGDKLAALTVDGDSMYPTLHRGDMVVCDSCGWSGEGIYALRMSGAGFVKRITKRPGKFVIISDNPKYPPQEEPEGSEDIEIIGRVHCAITKVE
jgi:phage repressor protein C with HTH and peptisase S24 domain